MTTIELYDQQFEFVASKSRRAAFVGGLGSGKTYAGCLRALSIAGQSKSLGVIVAPTYPMLRDATLRTFLDLAGDKVADYRKGDGIATLTNGSEILFRSADQPDRLRGPNLSWVYVDEAALCHQDVWLVVIGRLRQYGEAGMAWLTTTPKGRNWVWERFVQAEAPDHEIYRATTWDNVYLSPDFVEGLERDYVGAFADQELGGQFVAMEGVVYEEFSRDIHTWQGEHPTFTQIIAGVDWGYTNPATIMVLGLDSDNRVYVIDEYYQRGVRLEEHIAAAVRLRDQWGITSFECDPSEPEHIDEMQRKGLPASAADNSVMPGIQAVKARLALQGDDKPRLYVTAQTPNLAAEFESYAWKERRGGEKIDQPEKTSDHAMDALRYAIMGIANVYQDAGGINYAKPYRIDHSSY